MAGTYHKRPIIQGGDLFFTADDNSDDAPVLLYDTDSVHRDGPQIPRYIAKKIDVPPPSDKQLKVVSIAPPLTSSCPREQFNINRKDPKNSPQNSRNKRGSGRVVLATTPPGPPQLAFLLPFFIFLFDLGILIASFIVKETSSEVIAGCCVLVLIPDITALGLIFRSGVYFTAVVLHLMIWSSVILIFLQPFTSILLCTHILFMMVLIFFVLELRESFHNTFCILL